MAFDAFVCMDGIEGESSDSRFPGWMEVLDYGLKIAHQANRTRSSAGGLSTARAKFSEFTFRKQLDTSSPAISLACADGTHIDSVAIVFCRSGKDKVKFMEYQLSDCMISEVLTIGGGEFPSETISITFAKIVWTYSRQKRQGGFVVDNLATGWNLQKNCRV